MLLSEAHVGESYVVARLSGRWGIRRKLIAQGLEHGVTIRIKSIDSENFHVAVNGHIGRRRLPLTLAPFVTLVSANDKKLHEKLDDLCNSIPVISFGNPEILNSVFGTDIADFRESIVFQNDHEIHITHLPNTDTIAGKGENETKIRELITQEYPDLIVGIIDASRLKEDLYLASFFIDMDVKMMLIITGLEHLDEQGLKLDYEHLGRMLGIPILPYRKPEDKSLILRTLLNIHHNTEPYVRSIDINYGDELERSISRIEKHIVKDMALHDEIAPRYTAIRLLEGDENTQKNVSYCNRCRRRTCLTGSEIKRLEKLFDLPVMQIVHEARMSFINGGLKENLTHGKSKKAVKTERKLDAILTHKIWGIPIFFGFIFLTFFATFQLGKYPSDWLEKGILMLMDYLGKTMQEGALKSLIIDGILGGVGGILIYIPNIFILFFFIGFLEITGYLSRGAFLVDKYMHHIGLHGKSFIPLIMGFGCTVPAIMATRMLDDRRNRLLTMLIVPFMSCSARLPVYVLMIAAFFPEHPTLILFIIYSIGILFAIITAFLFNKTIFRKKEVPYVMQLTNYHKPSLKMLTHYTWIRGREYLKKIAGIILLASVLIWALGYYPRDIKYSKNYDTLVTEATDTKEVKKLNLAREAEQQENSYIGKIGKFIQPAMDPLGFDWKMSISVLTGIAGKEIVVSTMGVLYQASDENGHSAESLPVKLSSEKHTSGNNAGKPVFNKVSAFAFIIFILLYFPCMGVVVAIWKESEKFKWSLFTVIYTTALAWIMAFLVNQIGSALFL
ncbi:MAG: ferrous iron transport protein B [Bacteroidales bacterium]|nr:ferrous iron transport protein B [Bacteroidales bacterium]